MHAMVASTNLEADECHEGTYPGYSTTGGLPAALLSCFGSSTTPYQSDQLRD